MKKLFFAVLIALAFVAGYLAPRQSTLTKGQAYKAGDYIVYYRTYKGKAGKVCQKIDIQGKHKLIGGVYQRGATIEENK